MTNKVVSFHYTLTGDSDEVLDKSGDDPLSFLAGSGHILPKLEERILTMEIGENAKIYLKAADAYGERNEDLVDELPKEQFPGDIDIGQQFSGETNEGAPIIVTITDIKGDIVTVDANHPLAGQALNFDITIADVRDATDEEKAQAIGGGDGCCGGQSKDGGCGCH